ncbi:MAG: metallophosphoesterase [Roseburia sp.]|nr:metallophosphoesterase [Roseburia sp.]
MLKIFVTGDNHFGKKYDRYPHVREQLLESRFECLTNMVEVAEKEACGIFAVTGDLFDNINYVNKGDVKKVVEALSKFSGLVLVLPGNHDYYTGDEKVWRDFEEALEKQENNIILLKEFQEYTFTIGEERVVVYPALCQSKHSNENNLDWMKEAAIQKEGVINIGIAHGAILGVTPDLKNEYFLMTENELMGIPVDAWLIGHTHIPYPADLKEEEDTVGYKIFNAGTHEQTDLHNNTEGNGFILKIEKQGSVAKVSARKYISGKIRFYDLEISVKPTGETALEDAIKNALEGKSKNAIVRVTVSGTAKPNEYCEKESIYQKLLGEYLSYEKKDDELSEEITVEKIRSEFAETSFAAQFMEQLMDNPTEVQMAYELLQSCRES